MEGNESSVSLRRPKDFIKEEINKELTNLIIEVLHRLERENPQILQSLFPYSEEEQVSKLKSKKIKVPA
jgi:hypothetical protein